MYFISNCFNVLFQCFCSNCSTSRHGKDIHVLHPGDRYFTIGEMTSCLHDNKPVSRNDTSSNAQQQRQQRIPIKFAILLPSMLFIAAFVGCFISSIYICKDLHLKEKKTPVNYDIQIIAKEAMKEE